MIRYCGREFTAAELELIRHIIRDNPAALRFHLSRLVCQALDWYKPDGKLKEMSCRVAMLRMQKDGLIQLPPASHQKSRPRTVLCLTSQTDPGFPVTDAVQMLPGLHLEQVSTRPDSRLWNEYIHRYHYLGFFPLPGAQLRYFACSGNTILALLGFGAAAWKTAPRDNFIGWSDAQRQKNLHLVVNNARFLILPWVKSPNLASKLLAMAALRLPLDWHQRYGYQPLLLETFVESSRFYGTCYKAANWIRVGQTQGRGKLDVKHQANLPIKDVYLYPLSKNFKSALCA
jgi:hypothetical protein